MADRGTHLDGQLVERARSIVRVSGQVLDGDLSMVDGVRQLHPLLAEMGEFREGEYAGQFAPLSFLLLDVDPYPIEGLRMTDERSDALSRWLPAVIARHRPPVLEALRHAHGKYQQIAEGRIVPLRQSTPDMRPSAEATRESRGGARRSHGARRGRVPKGREDR